MLFIKNNPLSAYLDRTGMYSVVMHALFGIVGLALWSSFVGVINPQPHEIVLSFVVIIGTALIASLSIASILQIPAQHGSSFISALILVCLYTPSTVTADLIAMVVVTLCVVASKYVLVYKKQHILNPVAVGAVLAALLGFGGATWWIATPAMFLPILVLGGLIVAKVHKWPMVLTFVGVSLLVYLLESLRFGTDITQFSIWKTFFISYPVLFLGTIMLTEPFTMPGRRMEQLGYAALVAFLSNTALFSSLHVSMTPELALVVGNLVFFPLSLRQKLTLRLISRRELAPLLYEFTFEKPVNMQYLAGQYMEWMLPHAKADSRGIRRYFTITSAPEESVLRLALKVPTKSSTYKQALLALIPGDKVIASQRAGDFLMPKDATKKLAWVAGGIGVTPFVSQSTEMLTTKAKRDVVLFYATPTAGDAAYIDTLSAATNLIQVVSSGEVPTGGEAGFVTADAIARRVPDYVERTWFISGPPPMVNATNAALRSLKVPQQQIVRDFFPGLA